MPPLRRSDPNPQLHGVNGDGLTVNPREPAEPESRLDRTLRLVRSGGLGAVAARFLRSGPSPQLNERDLRRLDHRLEACLDPNVGEVVARSRTAEVAAVYTALDATGRLRFFERLIEHHGVDHKRLDAALGAYEALTRRTEAVKPAQLATARRELREALSPAWERLFRLLWGLVGGVKFAVDLRADLLAELAKNPELGPLDDDLRDLLKSLFDVGLLDLRRITWDSPASFLEKLIRYEAVHEITSWADLNNRLQADRRCYAFVHPGMPDEPLIFVEVALVHGLAAEIPPLLDQDAPLGDPSNTDTAIFYSISACQAGLAGVNLGDFLIKQVVADLRRDLPNLRQFATLSPIPGLRGWLDRLDVATGSALLTAEQVTSLLAFDATGASLSVVKELLARPQWPSDPAVVAVLRPIVLRLGAHYLLRESHNGRAHDRVANFHLSNGARVERLNWLANPSAAGMRESAGLMVNYRYDFDHIEEQHINYTQRGRIAASNTANRLLH